MTPVEKEWPGWPDVWMVRRYGYPGFPFPHQHCDSQALADAYVRKEEETAEVGPTETERYVPASQVAERLLAEARKFGKEADRAEATQEAAPTDAERRVWQGQALAWSAASDELRRFAAAFGDGK